MKEKTKRIINITFLLLFVGSLIIGFSFPGFVSLGGEEKQRFGRFTFVRQGVQWSTYINNKQALFDYLPGDVLDIQPLTEHIVTLILGRYEIDTTSGVNDTYREAISYSQYELANMMNFHYGTYVRIGMSANNSFNLPVITCNESTDILPVLYLRESNQTSIYTIGNCLIGEASSAQDIVRVKDRLLYSLLGII